MIRELRIHSQCLFNTITNKIRARDRNKFCSGKEFPQYVFAEQFDYFIWFDFDSFMKYMYNKTFIENLESAKSNFECKNEFFVNINSVNVNDQYLYNGMPLCEVKLNLNDAIADNWRESEQLNAKEKNSLEYFMCTHPEYYIYDSTRNWTIYCDRLSELCILGMKKNILSNFKFLKESNDIIKFNSVEDYYNRWYFIFKKEKVEWAIKKMKKNYPNIIT